MTKAEERAARNSKYRAAEAFVRRLMNRARLWLTHPMPLLSEPKKMVDRRPLSTRRRNRTFSAVWRQCRCLNDQ